MRVTINRQRVVTSINLKVEPKKWNAAAGKSSGSTRKDYELNARIDTIRARVMQIYREMELDREKISAQKVVDKYLGRDEKPVIMLLALFREHNDKCHKLAGNGMAPGTVERYETSYKHTAAFLDYAYKLKDIPVADVDHKFITDYEFYLKAERKCCHNSAVKYLKNFGKIIRIALANGYITKDPFVNILRIGFSKEDTFAMAHEKPVIFSGSLFSHEYQKEFATEKSPAKLDTDPKETGKLRLLVDELPIVEWFREKHRKQQQGIKPVQSKGIKSLSKNLGNKILAIN